MTEIRIIYDNISAKKGVKPAWGFAALVNYKGRKILFDTGGKPEVLLANMKAMKIPLSSVKDVFISHNHWDHAGGLFSFLDKNHDVKVHLPSSFSETYQKEVIASGAECERIKGFKKIAEDIFSTGPLGEAIVEQAMIIDTPKGLIVLTGCAHPGIVNVVRSIKKSMRREVYFIIGGFHLHVLGVKKAGQIIDQLNELGVKRAAPCHCTGRKEIDLFKTRYLDNFVEIGAGSVLSI